MDNEKMNNNEELEAVEETTEEVVEEIAKEEDVEEVIEEVVEGEEETTENKTIIERWQCTDCEAINETEECTVCGGKCELIEIEEIIVEGENANEIIDEKIVLSDRAKKGIATGVAVVVCLLIAYIILSLTGVINVYEKNIFTGTEYIDTTGRTLEQAAEEEGYTVSEYKKMYDLPMFMHKSTNENAAMNSIPIRYLIDLENESIEAQRKRAESMKAYGMEYNPDDYKKITIEDFRKRYDLSKKITEKSTLGEAQSEMKLLYVFNLADMSEEEQEAELAYQKAYYGLDKKVTVNTKYKEVRKAMDEVKRQERIDPELKNENTKRAEAARAEAEKKNTPAEAEVVPEEVIPEVVEPEVAEPETVEEVPAEEVPAAE